jgi:hypothetical protein
MRGRMWRLRIDPKSHRVVAALRLAWIPWRTQTSPREKLITQRGKKFEGVHTHTVEVRLKYLASVNRALRHFFRARV